MFLALRVILSGAQPWNVELSRPRRQTHSPSLKKEKKEKSLFNYILVLTVRGLEQPWGWDNIYVGIDQK